MTETIMGRHWKVKEIATVWNLNVSKVWRLFRREPGVLRFQEAKRVSIRIPEEVMQRVYRRLVG